MGIPVFPEVARKAAKWLGEMIIALFGSVAAGFSIGVLQHYVAFGI